MYIMRLVIANPFDRYEDKKRTQNGQKNEKLKWIMGTVGMAVIAVVLSGSMALILK